MYERIAKIVGKNNIKKDYPLREYTTFKIGGKADYFITPETQEQVVETLIFIKQQQIPYFVLGKGSNILISDEGYKGVIINLTEKFNKIEVCGEIITAQSGANLKDISKIALEHSLTGLEFAVGIPGSVGGAVFMNAGAYGGEIKDCIHKVSFVRQTNIMTQTVETLEFGYRKSTFQKNNDIVLTTLFKLKSGIYNEIKDTMDDLTNKRQEKQPIQLPSAGSVFKRPEGYFAGKLIEDCGLRGFKIGGAQVSTKHCGFIVNTGVATSDDVKQLIKEIQKRVKDRFGVELEREIRFL